MQGPPLGAAACARAPQFLHTAQRIAHELALDYEKIASGYPMRYQGISFWLQEYGLLDRDGLTLMIEVGQLNARDEHDVCRQLLECNYVIPAGVQGYFAVMPGSNVIASCIRIDFDKVADPAAAVFDIVRSMAESRPEITARVEAEMGRLVRAEATVVEEAP
jgi:hypothetical protein